jgi:hypothetical protein
VDTREKYSLVIQGPILSVGIAGNTYQKHFADKSQEHVVRYNCVENIRKLLQKYAGLFEEVVVSTWENEEITESDIAFCPNCKLIKSKDITPVYKNEKHPNGQIGLLKQFYSIQQGMKMLANQSPDHYIIKIRTDQFIDLTKMLAVHDCETEADRNSKIYIPYFAANSVADFYFAATRKNMEDLCQAVMNCVQMPQVNIAKTSVHIVIPYVYYIFLTGARSENEPGIFLKSFYPRLERLNMQIINCREAQKMAVFTNEHFASFSGELLYASEWRGSHIEPNNVFMFGMNMDFDPRCPKLNAWNMFIYLSPETYFEQRGKRSLKAILGLFNFVLLNKLPFYKKSFMKKYRIQPPSR